MKRLSNNNEKTIIKKNLTQVDSFQMAIQYIGKASPKISNIERLELYAYYKQANFGECNALRPSAIDLVGRAKWDSWNKLGNMSRDEAMRKYVECVCSICPEFDPSIKFDTNSVPENTPSGCSMGVSVSTMASIDQNPKDWEIVESIFHFASIGEVRIISDLLDSGSAIDQQDEEGRAMLHWAVDRGHFELTKFLVSSGAYIDIQDIDGCTPLAYAVNCEYLDIVKLLVEKGANINLKDNDGDSPLTTSSGKILEALQAYS